MDTVLFRVWRVPNLTLQGRAHRHLQAHVQGSPSAWRVCIPAAPTVPTRSQAAPSYSRWPFTTIAPHANLFHPLVSTCTLEHNAMESSLMDLVLHGPTGYIDTSARTAHVLRRCPNPGSCRQLLAAELSGVGASFPGLVSTRSSCYARLHTAQGILFWLRTLSN